MGFLIIGIASLLTSGVLAVATFSGSSDCVDECHGYALPLVASLALAGLGVLAVIGGLSSVLRDEGDPRYERAATRWVGRLAYAHPEIGLKGAEQIARALRDLDGPSETVARSQLGVLVRRACSEAADVLSHWGR